ncbi:hypothetical protein DPMN_105709 [Dreissena polymorpha]|uniref:Uncharacterized protein n=1 Tax=Dreissena polymorpha TaxID=45954 RepID=A0A9D4K3R3_DREPO|nr:hypothetical protein DPMN_105709 [Dreissena polymorpha]
MDGQRCSGCPFASILFAVSHVWRISERDNQLHALRVLMSYMRGRRNRINIYHTETALNVLGNCYERKETIKGR